MDLSFDSIEQLYKRVKPALNAKKEELNRLGFSYIKEEDIWKYLSEIKWTKSQGLTLSDIVSDILHLDNKRLDSYIKSKLTRTGKRVNIYEEN